MSEERRKRHEGRVGETEADPQARKRMLIWGGIVMLFVLAWMRAGNIKSSLRWLRKVFGFQTSEDVWALLVSALR